MRGTTVGTLAVAALAAGIVAYKQVARGAHARDVAADRALSRSGSTLLLVADAREADEPCGCGQIIRLVRETARHGVPMRELSPASPEIPARYRVMVTPSVLVLAANGDVLERFEGEGDDVVAALRLRLQQLSSARR